MPAWLLPPNIADILPVQAHLIESLRARSLAVLFSYGYELVLPPLIEYADSLDMGSGRDLVEQTFYLASFLGTGPEARLALRADTTPQIARIDAHILNRTGVTRLCYAGSVLRRRTSVLQGAVEPLQLGAEQFGNSSISADAEMIAIAFNLLGKAGVEDWRFDFCHAAIIDALLADDPRAQAQADEVITALQAKDRSRLKTLAVKPYWSDLLSLYGTGNVLRQARKALPQLPAVERAIADLEQLQAALPADRVNIDLADMRGYRYHSGVMFTVYAKGLSVPLAAGGRYDRVGERFGRPRPATGFSLDLRNLAELLPPPPQSSAILVNWSAAQNQGQQEQLQSLVMRLRSAGEIVVSSVGDAPLAETYQCDRQLQWRGDCWQVVSRA